MPVEFRVGFEWEIGHYYGGFRSQSLQLEQKEIFSCIGWEWETINSIGDEEGCITCAQLGILRNSVIYSAGWVLPMWCQCDMCFGIDIPK